ncbi:hypothetical protein HMPREF9104_01307 [Lentilactobacillus kisonensis F0435]|uniref:Uncharacterized protein n=1 Tax=Lentilactobacillus kisonensis F0435 TaxID=797516 RepID=H1LFD1_9LACO|nr:hypothetical protein HMPREF9104_01307 [Lentilactobacillus kisonensis F0435]
MLTAWFHALLRSLSRTAAQSRNFHISTLVKNSKPRNFCPRRLMFQFLTALIRSLYNCLLSSVIALTIAPVRRLRRHTQ